MSEEKVIYLANKQRDAELWDIPGMLSSAQKDLKENETGLETPTNAILILLDNTKDEYDIASYHANINAYELIALLTVTRQKFINQIA